jgi:hypothetical protein
LVPGKWYSEEREALAKEEALEMLVENKSFSQPSKLRIFVYFRKFSYNGNALEDNENENGRARGATKHVQCLFIYYGKAC